MADRYLYDAYGNPIKFIYDEMTDEVTLHHKQDVEPIIDHNKRLRNYNDGYSASREFKRVASIPLGLIQQWLTEDGISAALFWQWPAAEQRKYCAKRYMDLDYQHLRTS